MGKDNVEALREVGRLLAFLKEPEPPKGMKDAWEKISVFKQALNMPPRVIRTIRGDRDRTSASSRAMAVAVVSPGTPALMIGLAIMRDSWEG